MIIVARTRGNAGQAEYLAWAEDYRAELVKAPGAARTLWAGYDPQKPKVCRRGVVDDTQYGLGATRGHATG